MSSRDFGGLIRDHRDRLGLTQTRVAELVGRAPGTVRSWERGQATPTDANVLSSLAAVLAIDEGRLFEAAGMEAPVADPTPTLEQSLAEIAPPEEDEAVVPRPVEPIPAPKPSEVRKDDDTDIEITLDQPVPVARQTGVEVEGHARRGFVDEPFQAAERPSEFLLPPMPEPLPPPPIGSVAEPDRVEPVAVPPEAIAAIEPTAETAEAETATEETTMLSDAAATLGSLLSGARRRLGRVMGDLRRRPARPSRPTGSMRIAPRPSVKSYMEVPEERLAYRARNLYTVVGLVVLVVVLGWAASNAAEAFRSSIHGLLSGL